MQRSASQSIRPVGRRRQRSTSPPLHCSGNSLNRLSPSRLFSLFFALFCYVTPTLSIYDYCQSVAFESDGGDLSLSQAQFATMVKNLTDGELDFFTDYASIPAEVTLSYSTRADQSRGLDMSDDTTVVGMCT